MEHNKGNWKTNRWELHKNALDGSQCVVEARTQQQELYQELPQVTEKNPGKEEWD